MYLSLLLWPLLFSLACHPPSLGSYARQSINRNLLRPNTQPNALAESAAASAKQLRNASLAMSLQGASFQEDVIIAILQSSLSIQSLGSLSRVCVLWRRYARVSACWAGKEVRLSTHSARTRDLLDWWPAWSRASRVFLRRSQADGIPDLPSASAFEHPWGQWSVNSARGWHRIYLDGYAFQACMTQEESPDTANLVQDVSQGTRFRGSVWAGLTTADSPEALSRMSSQIQDRSSLEFSDVLAVEISTRDSESLPEPEALYISTTMAPGTSVHVPYFKNMTFNHDEPEVASFRFDRVNRRILVDTTSSAHAIAFGQQLGNEALAAQRPVRFFVAALCAGEPAPDVRLLPTSPK